MNQDISYNEPYGPVVGRQTIQIYNLDMLLTLMSKQYRLQG